MVSYIEFIGGQVCFYNGDVCQIVDLCVVVVLVKSCYGCFDIVVNVVGIVNVNLVLEMESE